MNKIYYNFLKFKNHNYSVYVNETILTICILLNVILKTKKSVSLAHNSKGIVRPSRRPPPPPTTAQKERARRQHAHDPKIVNDHHFRLFRERAFSKLNYVLELYNFSTGRQFGASLLFEWSGARHESLSLSLSLL